MVIKPGQHFKEYYTTHGQVSLQLNLYRSLFGRKYLAKSEVMNRAKLFLENQKNHHRKWKMSVICTHFFTYIAVKMQILSC